jgi:hypothetical protein
VLQPAFPNLKSKQNLFTENKPTRSRLKPTYGKTILNSDSRIGSVEIF